MNNRSSAELREICLKLARFRKENKELLTYLLFEVQDEQAYIRSVKERMDHLFHEINISHIYFAKKSIRKIVRSTNKFIRYSGKKQTEAELLLHFCRRLKSSAVPINKSVALSNIYSSQMRKIKKAMRTLHEDLQFDYAEELKSLGEEVNQKV
jgi:hypothetical protein